MNRYGSEFEDLDHFIVHISDTHFISQREPMFGVVDCDANLRELLDQFCASGAQPEALVFTGDLADRGQADAYRRLRAMVEPVAAELGAELIWVMGNHDNRAEFAAELLDLDGVERPIDRVFDLDGLRIVAVDSTVPGYHYGALEDGQLEWLRDVLSTPAPDGTLLALHHPPIPSPIAGAARIELREQDRLAEVIAGTDIRGILAGHLHYSTTSMFAGVPVSVASATCYTQDLNVVYPGSRGVEGAQAFNLVHVYPDRVLHSVVPVGKFAAVVERTPEEAEELLADRVAARAW